MVSFRYDAPEDSPREVAAALARAVEGRSFGVDAYSLGGAVRELELEMAARLGKEEAVFMPTGTLANHLALRVLATRGRRILVQERSHVYNDMGDALSGLSGFNLVPLGPGRVHLSLEEAEAALADAGSMRVSTGIGALSIESPVRRCLGATFDFGEMGRLSAWAREGGIGRHLDGARLFIASRYSGLPVRSYTELFDTVYVSLYKYFGTPSGAILAGPAALLEGMFHDRRRFGGGLNQAWIFAALALESLPRFEADFSEAVETSEALIGALGSRPSLRVSRVAGGTNVFILALAGGSDPSREARLAAGLRGRGILVPEAVEGHFHLKVNTSLLGVAPLALADEFEAAAREA